jgi:exodeoxyribonuclease VII large subunit
MKAAANILTVSELTRNIKQVLEAGFTSVTVQGEISNFKRHTSGHIYFTLKDNQSQLQAVLWRTRAPSLTFTPQDGMNVVARGKITVYEVRGNYQIDVAQLQPLGVGELQLAFERLKRQLASEGLFDQPRKKPLPRFPSKIGIITSPTGAAIRDIVQIIGRRYPLVELVIAPVNVQGAGAAKEIADAIDDMNAWGGVEVLIVGRGGGSLEDLWAFNEETVARAIARSAIPVVSAVGHEIDFTIADFVADLRAPTPSAAAELIVPDRGELVENVRNFWYTAQQAVRTRLKRDREEITALVRSYSFNKPFDLVSRFSQRVDELQRTMEQSVVHGAALARQRVDSLEQRIAALNPHAVLARGYAIVSKGGALVGDAARLRSNDEIEIRMRDGDVPATVR